MCYSWCCPLAYARERPRRGSRSAITELSYLVLPPLSPAANNYQEHHHGLPAAGEIRSEKVRVQIHSNRRHASGAAHLRPAHTHTFTRDCREGMSSQLRAAVSSERWRCTNTGPNLN
jgi:hypothetical protein